MDFLAWTAATGGLLLLMSLASGWIHRGPVTSFGLYLFAGVLCGPWMLNLLQIDILGHADLAAHITEITMAASLFITGLKLRLPLRAHAWRVGVRLAFPAMLLTVAGMTLLVRWLTGFDWSLALAFAAIVAPTDPVLASLISVNDARDDDALRVALSSEAGMNDGSALPLLMLALLMLHQPVLTFTDISLWAARDAVWAIGGGLVIGYAIGRVIGQLATHLRSAHQDVAPNDILALALIALSYAAAQSLDASGFLATFAAGVGLRRAELRVVKRFPPEDVSEEEHLLPAEARVNPNQRLAHGGSGMVKSVGLVVGDALSFGDTIERLLAAAMMVVLGITLAHHWNLTGIGLALLLFMLVRPLAVWITTLGCGLPLARRVLIGWLGIRGIGSINYIAYAWVHGMHGPQAEQMVDMALTLVVCSIVLHGVTVTPLLNWRAARQASRTQHD
ncbi:cation:proton antiporter [Pantoea cypripedii]|uniref:Sodium:proton antiporter n=1 Tax=Pantoea cypripedii TaxID=55209 RepID=A0A1X1EZI8_PANCY|nr:cation:proton antiporter [Pantoea cypripedii]MBP2195568.1 NhaP-type Na+/H+ or K+/H+ antiporter [Pantoea cypripedii]ORM95402.1 sodium:proton antiporter [Pantoea cypripedii]